MITRPRVRFALGLLVVACLAFVGGHALAQTGLQSQSLQDFAAATKLPSTPLPIIVARLIRAVLGVMGILLTCLIVYAGYQYMTAGGDAHKTERAKNIIKNAIIGLVIALSAFSITQFILSRLEQALGLGGVNTSISSRYSEPLAGALNGKVIQDHYPARNALDVPRNTKIMVTFVGDIAPKTVIAGYDTDPTSKKLNVNTVKIYATEDKESAALATDKVLVSYVPSADKKTTTFVFKPVDLLGNDLKNTNYTVALKPGIRTVDNKEIFGSTTPQGYEWTFEVSTKVDLTPPQVVSVVPSASSQQARNTTVEVTFNEAMDPTTVAGVFDGASNAFTNLKVEPLSGGTAGAPVHGNYDLSNGYRTVDFTTDLACAKDDCGNVVYCLPGNASLRLTVQAASVCAATDDACKAQNTGSPPQALALTGLPDGAADAAGNSLDGNADGKAQGKGADDFTLPFSTTDAIDDRKPSIDSTAPSMKEQLVNPETPVSFTFNMPMKASTLTNANLQIWPDPADYTGLWFTGSAQNLDAHGDVATDVTTPVSRTRGVVNHPPLVRKEDGGHDYYPTVTSDVRGNNQFCYFPGRGPSTATPVDQGGVACGVDTSKPYCCSGVAQAGPCIAPKASEGKTTPIYLPDTTN